ncbi:MAG TPA: hypothetical protein VE646_08050, partial [Actinomycetota bacterium]|nr:hypothetical protein [Actinomycetota bacterium]
MARRRGFSAFIVVVAVVTLWLAWPSGGGPGRTATGRSGPGNSGRDGAAATSSPSPAGQVGPDSPIKHVVFIVKENRTFNSYFATYPGAEGSTTGGTL